MKKRNYAISVLLILLTLTMVLSSCSNDSPPAQGTGTASEEEATEVVTKDLYAEVPVADYEKYEFKVLVTNHNWAVYDMVGAEGTDNVLQEIYERNALVEERLNIVITQELGSGASIDDLINVQSLNADPDNYDAIWHAVSRINLLTQKNSFYDLATVQSMKINDTPWWFQDFNDTINLGDKRFTLMGSLNMVYYSAFGVCAFNKTFLNDLDQDADLFAVYDSGNWTWEAMYEYMRLAAGEKNGDDVISAANDNFGLAMHYNALKTFLTSSGLMITERNAQGYPEYNGISEQFGDAYRFIIEKITDPELSIIPSITNGYSDYASQGGSYQNAFNEGRVLFQLEGTGSLSRNRNGGVDYGLIGYPKYTEEQKQYYSPVYYGLSGLCVLHNNPDMERTGVILENLSAYSYGTVDDAYVGNVLYYRYANDPQSNANMKKVLETGIVDVAYLFNWGAIILRVEDAQKKRDPDVTTLFKKAEVSLKNAIKDTVKYYSGESETP